MSLEGLNLSEIPSLAPPPGVMPNLVDPPNGNYIAIPVITVCAVLSAIFFGVRFYGKWATKSLRAPDVLCFIAFPMYWVYIWISYRVTWSPGYLIHQWNVPLSRIESFSYVAFVATLLYLAIVGLVKVAILLEWISIFVPNSKRTIFVYLCWATAASIGIVSIILIGLDLGNCTPFARNYNPLIMPSHCKFSVSEATVVSASLNLAFDIVPLALAQKVIWGLNMSFERKVGVSIVFLIGLLGIASSIVRLYFAVQFYHSNDTTFHFSGIALCTLAETTCAILVLCVPLTPRAIRGLTQSRFYSQLHSYILLRTTQTGRSTGTDGSAPYGSNRSGSRFGNSNKGQHGDPQELSHIVKTEAWLISKSGVGSRSTHSDEFDKPHSAGGVV